MKFNPGFRLSIVDIVFLSTATIASVYLYTFAKPLSYIVAFVVGHFFLFCNITRMSRLPELIWAVVFTALSLLALKFSVISLPVVFLVSTFLTTILVVLESRKPHYHGILWEKVNPNLETWFTENSSNKNVI